MKIQKIFIKYFIKYFYIIRQEMYKYNFISRVSRLFKYKINVSINN